MSKFLQDADNVNDDDNKDADNVNDDDNDDPKGIRWVSATLS